MVAEHAVDEIVANAFFADVNDGVMVEVGAAGPDYLSISARFRSLGWKVVAIEPNPDFCEKHRALGHEVLQYAASDVEADDVPFTIVDSLGADYEGGNVSFESFSSLGIDGKYAELLETVRDKTSRREVRVQVRTLDSILARHAPEIEKIDLLSVDVEGWELNVMRGLTRFQPKVAILENLFHDPAYNEYMASRGYRLWKRLGPNDIYAAT